MPHLEYCSFVWDPPLVKDQEALESVQKFALRLCCKKWSAAYLILLDSTGLTTLSAEPKIAKMCFLYKIVNNLTSFPANIIRFRSPVPFHIRSCHALLLSVPHVRTGYCYFYFVHIVPVSCGTLYHLLFCSHVLVPLLNTNLKIFCNFLSSILAHSGSVLVLALVLFDMSCTHFCIYKSHKEKRKKKKKVPWIHCHCITCFSVCILYIARGGYRGGSLGAEEPPSGKIHYKLSRGRFRGGGAFGVITNLYHLCTC